MAEHLDGLACGEELGSGEAEGFDQYGGEESEAEEADGEAFDWGAKADLGGYELGFFFGCLYVGGGDPKRCCYVYITWTWFCFVLVASFLFGCISPAYPCLPRTTAHGGIPKLYSNIDLVLGPRNLNFW